MIFLVLLIFVILFVFIAKFGVSYAAKLTEKMMTTRFQDANTILNEKTVPRGWINDVERRVFNPNSLFSLLARFRDLPEDKEIMAKTEIMVRLVKLQKYFEKCPFFEDPESRKVMLEELEGVKADWEPKAWQELVSSAAV
jgi:hypothetical protein